MASCYCDRQNDDNQLDCSSCGRKVHRKCEGITLEDWKKLEKSISIGCRGLKFYCRRCEPNYSGAVTLNDLDRKMDMFESMTRNMFASLEKQIIELKTENEFLRLKATNEQSVNDLKPSYSDMVKERNLILIADEDENEAKSMIEKKAVITKVLGNIQISNLKTTKKGSLVVDFPDKKTRENAKRTLDQTADDHKLCSTVLQKMFPKITVANVSNLEQKDDVLPAILRKNNIFHGVDVSADDMKLVSTRVAKDGKSHNYTFKCTPAIRRKIYENGDIIFTNFGRHKVWDSYHVIICNYCQGYGHFESKCRVKASNGTRICGQCNGTNHETTNCESDGLECHHCARMNLVDKEHAVFNWNCPSHIAERKRIAEQTDHGFQ